MQLIFRIPVKKNNELLGILAEQRECRAGELNLQQGEFPEKAGSYDFL